MFLHQPLAARKSQRLDEAWGWSAQSSCIKKVGQKNGFTNQAPEVTTVPAACPDCP